MSDPIAEAQAALRAADVSTLLTKAYQLTHKIHHHEQQRLDTSDLLDLRAQRDLITAEIVRRDELAQDALLDSAMIAACEPS